MDTCLGTIAVSAGRRPDSQPAEPARASAPTATETADQSAVEDEEVVPNLIGLRAIRAERKLDRLDFALDWRRDPPSGTSCRVTRQSPRAGTIVARYARFRAVCKVDVPSVIGADPRDAENALDDRGVRSRLVGVPGYSLHRCEVSRQSRRGPTDPTPTPQSLRAPAGCDPNYTPCVPAYPPDLDCPDTGPVTVIGSDPHGLDADGDGVACGGD